MGTERHLTSTPRRARVTGGVAAALLLATAGLLGLPASQAEGEKDAPKDLAAMLRRASRGDAPLAERLGLLEQVLASKQDLPAGAAARAGAHLLREAVEPAAWLIHKALNAGYIADEDRAAIRIRANEALAAEGLSATDRVVLHAVLFRIGVRPDSSPAALTTPWPAPDVVLAILRADLAALALPGGQELSAESDVTAVRGLIQEQLPVLRALDLAEVDDADKAVKGLDALKSLGAKAVPLLIAETRRAAARLEPGRQGRASRAILVLGHLKDRRATPALIAALKGEDGWVRTYAATALGDLRDPAAVVALARQCTILGDPLRDRDQWEFPGVDNTPVAPDAWRSSEYYVTDTACADALLRIGVRGAAGWLIHAQLDPRKKNFRIRVLQDSTDAIRRSVKQSPIAAYNVDSGLPLREAAWRTLVDWWHAHRHDAALLRHELDESDPRYQSAAKGLVDVFAGPSVREMMMAKAAIRLLGPYMTTALNAAIPNAKNAFHRAEIAESLGLVDDPRAVKGLMQLVRDKQAFVRKKAIKSLGAYIGSSSDARDLLVRFLRSKRAGSRLAAMEGLVYAAPSDAMRTTIASWIADDERERANAGKASWRTPDVETALTVVRLVQEGDAHLDAVMAGLAHEQRAQRRIWWDLVRAALDLPEPLHDPVSAPDSKTARRISKDAVKQALTKRRGA